LASFWTAEEMDLSKDIHERASFSLPLTLEHLKDFIYYAYTFYTGLLEESTLLFQSGWL
jgi:hypothetical protein